MYYQSCVCVATWSEVSPKSDISRHYSLNEKEGSLKAPCFFGVDFFHALKSNLSESRSFKINLLELLHLIKVISFQVRALPRLEILKTVRWFRIEKEVKSWKVFRKFNNLDTFKDLISKTETWKKKDLHRPNRFHHSRSWNIRIEAWPIQCELEYLGWLNERGLDFRNPQIL